MKIAVMPGDGVGKEVVPEGLKVLRATARKFGFTYTTTDYPFGGEHYLKTQQTLPDSALRELAEHDAILFGAVGVDPRGMAQIPQGILETEILLKMRFELDQFINLRPTRLLPGVPTPLKHAGPDDIDMVIVRENTEGEYGIIGRHEHEGTEDERVIQESIFTRRGVDRIMRYAFEVAGTRKGHVTSATKSNGLAVTMPYWDARFRAMAAQYPAITTDQFHVDILAAQFVRNPHWFDVVVGSNLFGDILSDLAPACCGTIAIAPSANLNPERKFPSMFEPVHGSAPDIAGQGIANPIGQIWAGSMMLQHLGQPEAAASVMRAIELVLAQGPRTPDLGGRATTQEVGSAILAALSGSRT